MPAGGSGYINYYAREGERVGFGKLVCSIDESGQLKEMFDAGKADDTQLSDNIWRILKVKLQAI